jgi:hypothetical protein
VLFLQAFQAKPLFIGLWGAASGDINKVIHRKSVFHTIAIQIKHLAPISHSVFNMSTQVNFYDAKRTRLQIAYTSLQ